MCGSYFMILWCPPTIQVKRSLWRPLTHLLSKQCQTRQGCSGPCPVSVSKGGDFTNPLLQCLTTLLVMFFPLISDWNFPHHNLCPLPFTFLLCMSEKLCCIFSVPSNWAVKDCNKIPLPPPFSLLRSEHTQLSQSLLVHPWSPSKCAMWSDSSILSAGLSVCWQGLLLLEQRGRPPCEGLWKITADTVISVTNSSLNRVSWQG